LLHNLSLSLSLFPVLCKCRDFGDSKSVCFGASFGKPLFAQSSQFGLSRPPESELSAGASVKKGVVKSKGKSRTSFKINKMFAVGRSMQVIRVGEVKFRVRQRTHHLMMMMWVL
jgi:hypothetical protein